MAAPLQQQQQRKRTAACTFLLFPALLALALSPPEVAGATSSAFPFSCTVELAACYDDPTCNTCLVSWPVGGSPSACEEYSIEAAEPAVEAEIDSCEETGAESCCGFEAGTAESCMENALLEAYWACNLEIGGCALEDMPCSVAGVAAAADATAAADDAAADAAADADSAAPAGGPPFLACRYGGGVFAAVVVALAAAAGL